MSRSSCNTALGSTKTSAHDAQVSQLHVHVTARDTGDPSWPGPCYGAVPPAPHAPFARQALIQRLRKALLEQAPPPPHQTRRLGQVNLAAVPLNCALRSPGWRAVSRTLLYCCQVRH